VETSTLIDLVVKGIIGFVGLVSAVVGALWIVAQGRLQRAEQQVDATVDLIKAIHETVKLMAVKVDTSDTTHNAKLDAIIRVLDALERASNGPSSAGRRRV
jgi:hypothetical protein